MNKIRWIWLILLIILLGCGGAPITKLYMLHMNQITSEDSPSPISVGISPLSINPVYSNHGIAYQQDPYQIQFYHYHQWAGNPAHMIDQVILGYLKQTNKFSALTQLPGQDKVDFAVSGQILKFTEWNDANQWYGWLEIDFQIFRTKDNKLIWRGQISKKIPAQQKNPISVVKALSKAAQEVAEELAEKIISRL